MRLEVLTIKNAFQFTSQQFHFNCEIHKDKITKIYEVISKHENRFIEEFPLTDFVKFFIEDYVCLFIVFVRTCIFRSTGGNIA
jgi:hypothetical protein